ncbi:MAG: hypothetical protein KatS3mg053_3754 [Candidatus Roseilinea sp.]|nr:MAG: hypothetical protein KatS3mg053_3754 [Candidatus Roseilinea sp.]
MAVISGLYALHELGIVQLPYPQLERQVQSDWRNRYPPLTVAVFYGFQLGAVFLTYIPVATVYVVSLSALLYGPVIGMTIFLCFGLGRAAIVPLVTGLARTDYDTRQIAVGMIASKPLIHMLNGGVLAATAIFFATLAVSGV